MSIIKDSFMLHSETAQKLYHEYAKDMPIIDYHCHLIPKMIAENHRFKNITELFLGGDHYKWRAMRSMGIDEEYITGKADDYEKFLKFAEVLPYLIGNPLYHWTHLELKRYFDIDEALSLKTADDIWSKCNELLAKDEFRARSLVERSNVEVVCTTDDPADDLSYHIQLKNEKFTVKVLPTFRPDKAVEINKATFLPYLYDNKIKSYSGLLEWLSSRIEFFHSVGCRLSDHALEGIPFAIGDAEAVFNKATNREKISTTEEEIFKTALMQFFAQKYTEKNWTMQIHMGALRNNNQKMFEQLGADVGYDSIADVSIAAPLSKLLDSFEVKDNLPKTILYSLNPKDNYTLGTMIGNFQKHPVRGKLQLGSGWWFNDQRDGMVAQLKTLANSGALGSFVGMLTDSRSFVSYPRHEYFRRILCNLIGEWVEKGEYPEDYPMLKTLVQDICYNNANTYFSI